MNHLQSNKVLVIDDSKSIAKVVSAIASKAGFEPIIAYSLRDLESIITDSNEFFCACVDYNLPDAPNGEAIDFVVSLDIPAFVLTGSMEEATREHILSKPVIDYVPKETVQSFDYVGKLLKRLKQNLDTNILVVDDSSSARLYTRALLKRQNYQVQEAADGKSALEILSKDNQIKIMVVDHQMPGMTGIELVSEVRKTYNTDQLAIIGISASAEGTSLSARFLKNGANDFLTKPFSPEEFYTRIFRNIEYIENINKARKAATTDYLTGLYNRRHFYDQAHVLMQQAQAKQTELTLALFDLDKFKSVNDKHGHDVGDEVLQEMAKRLIQHFRAPNVVARLGGEEFCILMPNTGLDEATGRLEFLRHHIETFEFETRRKTLSLTTSIGLSQIQPDELDVAMKAADEALYAAKRGGRNQLVQAKATDE